VSGQEDDAGRTRLIIGVAGLVTLDLVGGGLAIANDVNTPGEAWSSKATLAAPLPMIAAQVLLATATVRWSDRRGAVAAGVLAAACLVSGVSGFFDGQLGKAGLSPPLVAFQWGLVISTLAVGGLAGGRLIQLVRRR
jgi:hypothetical protein